MDFSQIKRPFRDAIASFVQLSSEIIAEDVELDCVIIGIGTRHESHGYKVPVRVRYGRQACEIPQLKWVARNYRIPIDNIPKKKIS